VKTTKCNRCGVAIVWCVTEKGKRMPVNPWPDKGDKAKVVMIDPDSDVPMVRILKKDEVHEGPRRFAHFATCRGRAHA
jgi:hypothetical protein